MRKRRQKRPTDTPRFRRFLKEDAIRRADLAKARYLGPRGGQPRGKLTPRQKLISEIQREVNRNWRKHVSWSVAKARVLARKRKKTKTRGSR